MDKLTSSYFSQVAVTFARFFSSSAAFCRTVCNLLVSSVFSPDMEWRKKALIESTVENQKSNEVNVLSQGETVEFTAWLS